MLKKDHHIIEGELYFGDDVTSVSTLLGSCVAVVVWHPKLRVGGMCHIILPDQGNMECHNKYANCAISTISRRIKQIHSKPQDYVTCIYGGGKMFDFSVREKMAVGDRNIEMVYKILAEKKYVISEENVGGRCYRKIKLYINTGEKILESVYLDKTGIETAG